MATQSAIGLSAGAIWVLIASSACGAVYPEVRTPTRPPPAGVKLAPAPPEDLLYLKFQSAVIPGQTRDGRKWDSVGGAAPDPFAKLFAGGKELFQTSVQSNTLTPTWADSTGRNYRIPVGTPVRVELWDSNPINSHPICVKVVRSIHAEAHAGLLGIECDSGARVTLTVEPAHAKLGLGLSYEFRTESVYVTRVPVESPAARVGLKVGEQIVRIQGKDVKGLDEGEARSLINANAPTGVMLTVRRADGSVADLQLKDGPIYPTPDDDIPVD